MIDFSKMNTSREDLLLIIDIAKRAVERAAAQGTKLAVQTTMMDVQVVHHRIGLDLAGLLAATPYEFTHDVFGIVMNLNRETGELENCFTPRYAKQGYAGAKR